MKNESDQPIVPDRGRQDLEDDSGADTLAPSSRAGRHSVNVLVVDVGERQGSIDGDPVFEVELLVFDGSRPAGTLATSLCVPRASVSDFRAGASLSAEISPSDPNVLDVVWETLS